MNAAKIACGLIGIGTFCALLGAALFWRVEVRHSSPYGFSKTIDFDRGIAVPGGYVTANYPNFDRVDLDLRAYDDAATYDLTVHIRPAKAGATDVRVIDLDLPGSKIFHRKPAFGNPFLTVRFPAIANSQGQTYYVWLERGARNRENVVTVWSIKSYSTVPARTVARATLDRLGNAWGIGGLRTVAVLSALGVAAAASWAMAAMAWAGWLALRAKNGAQA